MENRPFKLIDNYIYLYHLDKYILIPTYPESIADTLQSTFNSQNALSRSAPVFAYSYSGPRTIQITLNLHRELMEMINYDASNFKIDNLDDDYVDTLVKNLQAICLPKYSATSKAVQPPMIAIRFGDEIFVKGVVNGSLSITYSGPILSNNKYAQVAISFNVSEVDPYDAESVWQQGSFRGITRTFKDGIYKGVDN